MSTLCGTITNLIIGIIAGIISGILTTLLLDYIQKKKFRKVFALYVCSVLENISEKLFEMGNAILCSSTSDGALMAYRLKEEIDSLVAICIGTKSLTSDEINTLKQIYSVHYYNVQDGLPIHGMEQRTKEFEDAKNQLSSIAASLKDVISKIQKEAQKSK